MGSLEDERERKRRVIAAERSNGVKIITPLNEIMASWDRFCCWFFFLLGREREKSEGIWGKITGFESRREFLFLFEVLFQQSLPKASELREELSKFFFRG